MALLDLATYKAIDPETAAKATDEMLQAKLDAIEAEIDAKYGAIDTASEVLAGGGVYVFPSRPVGSISTITEDPYGTVTSLDATDYEVLDGGRTLWRKTGVAVTHPYYRWGLVRLTYVPKDTEAIRIGVLVDLMKIDLTFTGVTSWTKGSWSETQGGGGQTGSRESLRREILERLSPGVTIY